MGWLSFLRCTSIPRLARPRADRRDRAPPGERNCPAGPVDEVAAEPVYLDVSVAPDAELSRGIERVHYKTQSTYQVLQKRYVAAQSGVNGVPIWEAAGYLGMSVLRNHRAFPYLSVRFVASAA